MCDVSSSTKGCSSTSLKLPVSIINDDASGWVFIDDSETLDDDADVDGDAACEIGLNWLLCMGVLIDWVLLALPIEKADSTSPVQSKFRMQKYWTIEFDVINIIFRVN